jgi:outer membrane protein
MKIITSLIIALLLSLCTATTVAAQEYGYLNFGNLIGKMPETTAADNAIKNFQDSLQNELEKQYQELVEENKQFTIDVQNGKLTAEQGEKMTEKLEKKQSDLFEFERAISQKVKAKREELLTPVIARAERAIKRVAMEKGLDAVLDTSMFNAVLFADESKDITAEVERELRLR